MELVPLGPGFGVEVKGVTMLDVATDAEAYKAVRSAFETHSLLVFRDQAIADLQAALSIRPGSDEARIALRRISSGAPQARPSGRT